MDKTTLDIEKFVVIDDETGDLQKFVNTNLVKTSKIMKGDIFRGSPYKDTELKRKHVKQAIKILNSTYKGGY